MNKISPNQIKQLQTICSKRFRGREERLDFLSKFTGEEVKTTKNLTERQAHEIIRYLNTGQEPDNSYYAAFDKDNGQHRAILSLAHQLGWVQDNRRHLVDLKILGSWIISSKSPVQKPIMQMKTEELSKVIYVLEQILKWKYKKANAPI